MSSIVNKVKEALHSDKSTTHEQPEGTHGTHNSRVANAADPRIDSDRDHRAAHNTTTGTSAHTGGLGNTHATQGTTHTGGLGNTHTSGLGNTHTTPGSTTHTTGTHVGAGNNYSTTGGTHVGQTSHSQAFDNTDGPASKTDGPHKSNLLNKADPRVDSDRDHSRNMGANPHGTSGTGAYDVNQTTRTGEGFGNSNTAHTGGLGNTHATHGNTTHTGGLGTSSNTYGTSAHTGGLGSNTGHSSNIPEGTAGPHGSRVANAADPRVDSDLDGSNRHQGTHTGGLGSNTGGLGSNTGAFGQNTTTHNTHSNTAHTGGLGSNTGGLGSNTGAFGQNTTTHNTHSNAAHTGGLGSNTGGLGQNTTTHNTHSNAAHTGGLGSSTTSGGAYGSGPAPNTTGPHKSDMMNKLDPRVDSNLDGSKTYGGDKTFQQSNESSAYTHKDPTDAAQVPPSVMQQHIGAPTVAHDNHEHEHARRHSVSHQEQHRGL